MIFLKAMASYLIIVRAEVQRENVAMKQERDIGNGINAMPLTEIPVIVSRNEVKDDDAKFADILALSVFEKG
jgi:hypothetical protein